MNHKELDVWKIRMELVEVIYNITGSFPDAEKFGLINQIRRAAVSIPSNIAEGSARNSNKEFIHFLYIALGSISELDTQIIISRKLNYIEESKFEIVSELIIKNKQLLLGLIKYLKSKDV